MAFAILRTQKLKSSVAVQRSMKHAFRAQDTPNADPERTPDNTHIGAQDVAEGMAAFNARLPAKFRKDAVQCIEYLVTASPDGMHAKDRAGQDAYFADALTWLRDRHGAENVVYAGIHRDETTPHLCAYVVPRDGEKLNAKKWLGAVNALGQMQTDFAEKVGKRHGLQRGVERSKASHTTIRQFYAEMQAGQQLADQHGAVTPAELVPRKLEAESMIEKLGLSSRLESPEMVADRLTQRVRPVIVQGENLRRENQKLKAEVATLRKQENSLRAELVTLRGKVAEFTKVFLDLGRSQVDKLLKIADQLRLDNAKEKRADQEAKQKLAEFDRQHQPKPRGR